MSPTGTTKNRPIANTTETSTVPNQAPPEISCSSSGSCALAEMLSARRPMPSDSTSATTPRITGRRYTRWRLIREVSAKRLTAIGPTGSVPASPWAPSGAGSRTATAQCRTPRIITPSSTA